MKKQLLLPTIAMLCFIHTIHAQSWSILGNSGTTSSHFLGTTDNVSLRFRTNNLARMIITSSGNVGIGTTSPTVKLQVSGGSISSGTDYRIGSTRVLAITGSQNVFVGRGTGPVITGFGNTFVGDSSGFSNTSGADNIFIGRKSGKKNTNGSGNTFVGALTAIQFTGGSSNTILGWEAGKNIKTVSNNTFIGGGAGKADTSGNQNTFVGASAGFLQASGFNNTYVGEGAGIVTTSSSGNTFIGAQCGTSNTTGSNNTYLGANSSGNATAANATAIGSSAAVNASNKVRVGNSSVTVIEGQVNFSASSDARLKTNINDYDLGLEFIKKLRPVSYQFREGDTKTEHHGFIAQEVEQVLGSKKFDGLNKPQNDEDNYSLAYASFVVPLVNAMQELDKENARLLDGQGNLKLENKKLESRIEKLESIVATMDKSSSPGYFSSSSSSLEQNSPNPFSTQTEINFRLPETFNTAQLAIADAAGKQMRSYDLNTSTSVIIKLGELAAGAYSYSLIVDGATISTKQMIVTK